MSLAGFISHNNGLRFEDAGLPGVTHVVMVAGSPGFILGTQVQFGAARLLFMTMPGLVAGETHVRLGDVVAPWLTIFDGHVRTNSHEIAREFEVSTARWIESVWCTDCFTPSVEIE